MTIRFEPRDFARQEWSDPAQAPPGKVYGRGKGYFEYRLVLPPSVVKAHPESFYFLLQASSKAKRERVDWPERENRQDYPQTDLARTWSSTLAILLNGRPVDRITLPDDAADARGVLSHLAGVEHGSHGELVDAMVVLTDRDRAILAAGEPMVLRLAVPDDAPQRGRALYFRRDNWRNAARPDDRNSYAGCFTRRPRSRSQPISGHSGGTLNEPGHSPS